MKIKEIQRLIDNPQEARELLKLEEAEKMMRELLDLQNFSFTLGVEPGNERYCTEGKCELVIYAQEDLVKHCGLFKHLIVKAELTLWHDTVEFKDGKYTIYTRPHIQYQHFDGGKNGMEFGRLYFDGEKWNTIGFLYRSKKDIAIHEGYKEEDGIWRKGKIFYEGQAFRYAAKVYDEGSEYGISKGRVSKLSIQKEDGETIVSYDRGWDDRPKTATHKALVRALVGFYGTDAK